MAILPTGEYKPTPIVTPQNFSPTITPQSLTPVTPVKLPTPPVDTTNYQAIIDSAKLQVQAIQDSLNKGIDTTTPPAPTPTPTPEKSSFDKSMEFLKKYFPTAPENPATSYAQAETDAQIAQKQADVNAKALATKTAQTKLANINAKITGISGEATAQNLALENQGGAITSRGVGVAQTQNIRDAAIRAIPLQTEALLAQAEVASAQGDQALSQDLLQQAQTHLDRVFGFQQDYVTAQNKYKTDLFNAAYEIADNEQQAALDKKKTEESQAFTIKQNNLNFAQDLAKTAIANGQATLASQITALDPNSKTYTQDVARLGGSITPKVDTQIIGSADTGYFQIQTDAQGNIIKKTPISGGGSSINGVTTGFKDGKVESSVREDVVSLLSDVEVGATTLDKAYAKLRKLYSPSEVTDEALKELMGITPPQNTTISQNTQTQQFDKNGNPIPNFSGGNKSPQDISNFQDTIASLLFS